MSTVEELIREAENAIAGMGDDFDAIEDFFGLICLLLTAPDIDGECPGLHRLLLVMREHMRKIGQRHDRAYQAIHRLANP
jgi:hypothetical protein